MMALPLNNNDLVLDKIAFLRSFLALAMLIDMCSNIVPSLDDGFFIFGSELKSEIRFTIMACIVSGVVMIPIEGWRKCGTNAAGYLCLNR
jgi:hypothetical protein